MSNYQDDVREWLETDGLGGFAMGTVCGKRTRRYHALLLVATRPPSGRVVLVNGLNAWVETPNETFPISTQAYVGGVDSPNGQDYLRQFTIDPWPTWEFAVGDGTIIRQELIVPSGVSGTALRWSVLSDRSNLRLHVRPFLSGRDYHALHYQNSKFCFESASTNPSDSCIQWQPYPGLPGVFAESNATYTAGHQWYHNFLYEHDQRRGLDFTEDLASPGEFHWNLEAHDAVLLLAAGKPFSELVEAPNASPVHLVMNLQIGERKRRAACSKLERSADAYLVTRGDGKTIIAGYPWFTDWGRDTFIAMRGLCLQPNRLQMAQQILLAWANLVSDGMLPNRFPDYGDNPEYNSVDASLWYIIAVHDYLQAMKRCQRDVSQSDLAKLQAAVDAILTGYSRGTRYGIRLDDDGLIAAGESGVQLTWMDAKVDDWVVTPRIGKPVEIQALWLNALHVATNMFASSPGSNADDATIQWSSILQHGRESFLERFWNEAEGCLYDVVDVDHEPGAVDAALRPNQVFAVGGLPLQLLDAERARRVVDTIESKLLTPMGLRSLDSEHPDYRPRYEGDVWERDGAYHQGTVWTWLMGPFVEAWVRVRKNSAEAKQEARRRFVEPLLAHLNEAGIGHLSEIADAEPPHTPRGCPFQAWSLGELMRLEYDVLRNSQSQHSEQQDLETVAWVGMSDP